MFEYQFANQIQVNDANFPLMRNYATTKLNETKFALLNLTYQPITLIDGAEYYMNDETKILSKVNNFVNSIRAIQDRYTKFKKPVKSVPSTHPWTTDKKYRSLVRTKKSARKQQRAHPSKQNASTLRDAHIAAYARYNVLKNQYYSRIIQQNNASKDFYTLIKSKITPKAVLPQMLTLNDAKYFGRDRFEILSN